MDSYAVPRSPRAPAALDRIAEVVYHSFEAALIEQCADRHSLNITVHCAPEEHPMHVQLRCHDLIEMSLRLAVRHVGGNVYDVVCSLENGPSETFVYCLPNEGEPPLPPVPRLGRELATFVLDAMEQSVGRQGLRKG